MAKKHLMRFEPGDILQVVIRCRYCNGELSFSVPYFSATRRRPQVPDHCPVCREDWGASHQASDYKSNTEYLVSMFDGVSSKSEFDSLGSAKMPWAVWLVVEGDPASSDL